MKDMWVYLLIAVLLTPSVVWVARDHAVWPWDPSWYGEVSVDLWFLLGHSIRGWCGLMASGLYMKPPGIVWLGQFFVPLGQIAGSIEAGLLLSVLCTQFGLLLIIFKIGQQIVPDSRLVAVAGTVFTSGTSLFVGLSHQFFPEPLQALSVAWVLLIVVKSERWPKPRVVLHLAGALILGALAKATTPLYVLIPLIYVGFVLLRKEKTSSFADEWKSTSSRLLFVGCCLAGVAGIVWYGFNIGHVWQHIREASSGQIALQYGFRSSLVGKLIVWTNLLYQSFLAPYLLWAFLAAFVAAVTLRILLGTVLQRSAVGVKLLVGLSLLQIALLLVVFSTNDAVDSRYMFALLPCLSIVFMSGCASARAPGFLAILIALCSWQWIAVNRAAFWPADELWLSEWPQRAALDRSRYDELTCLVEMTSVTPGQYNIVGVEEPWLNANSAAFFGAKNRLHTGVRSYYTSLGYGETDPARALKRIDEFQARYFITLDERFQTAPPNFVNIVSLPVLREMKASNHFQTIPFESQNGVLVFERTAEPNQTQPQQPAATTHGHA